MPKHGKEFLRQLAVGIFSVDEHGRVWRHKRYYNSRSEPHDLKKSRIVGSNKDGYLNISLSRDPNDNSKKMMILAHHAVWLAARRKIPDELEINHKNGIKTDNRLENLELVTHVENMRHARSVLGWQPKQFGKGEGNVNAKLTDDSVLKIRASIGETQRALAKRFGVSQAAINSIKLRKTWKHI